MPSQTLRDLEGLPSTPASLASSTLILIDIQNTYRSGVMQLEGAEAAVAASARLLQRARDAGARVIHIQQNGEAGSPYDIHAEIGRISDEVAPIAGEAVVVKDYPNAFHDTELATLLGERPESKDLVLAGFMTHMCVNYTAQGAFNLGYSSTVVADSTATRSLATVDGSAVPATVLQSSSLAGIGDLFGIVVAGPGDLPE